MQQWEYRTARYDKTDLDNAVEFERILNVIGSKGWELICCNSVGRMYELIFKRVKEQYAT